MNSQSLTLWTPYTYLPLCSFPPFTLCAPLHSWCSYVISTLFNTCLVCPHFAVFTPDVPFVGHLCQMKFTFLQVQLKCPLSGTPSQSSPSKISLVPPELPQPSSYTSPPWVWHPACCLCVCLTHPWADWGRPMSNLPWWHRVYFRGGCPVMFIDWMTEITDLA